MYEVTLWHVRVTIVARETQQCVLCVLFITYVTVNYTKISKVLSWKRSSGFYFVFLCHKFLSTIYKFFIVAKEMRTWVQFTLLSSRHSIWYPSTT
jgi:hypothetical protein